MAGRKKKGGRDQKDWVLGGVGGSEGKEKEKSRGKNVDSYLHCWNRKRGRIKKIADIGTNSMVTRLVLQKGRLLSGKGGRLERKTSYCRGGRGVTGTGKGRTANGRVWVAEPHSKTTPSCTEAGQKAKPLATR